MENKTSDVFVKIQKERYRLNCIKRYTPFDTESPRDDKFGITLYFAITGGSAKVYHYFKTERERDLKLRKLDELFNVSV